MDTLIPLLGVVVSDAGTRETVKSHLNWVGMEVETYRDPENLDQTWLTGPPDVVIMDIDPPAKHGLVDAARLRARSDILGLILLSAQAGAEDRILGLSMGIDYYLDLPLHLPELESVVRNLARRVGYASISQTPLLSDPTTATWTLYLHGWQLQAPNGLFVSLSSAEYSILLPLIESPGKPQSRETLNALLGKRHVGPENRSLDVLVSRLRRRISEFTGISLPLRSARGTGYVFTGDAKKSDTPPADKSGN